MRPQRWHIAAGVWGRVAEQFGQRIQPARPQRAHTGGNTTSSQNFVSSRNPAPACAARNSDAFTFVN
jgi:hypothetical protein